MPRLPHKPVVCACGNHAFAPMTHGAMHLFDAGDSALASAWRWCRLDKKSWAVVRFNSGDRKKRYFHREIMSPPDGMVVDHINGNQADNRRPNLRICTVKQNARNRRKRVDSKSRFKGVHYDGPTWRYHIWDGSKQVSGCGYATEEAAALAYNDHALKIFGAYARLNAVWPNGRPATRSAISHPALKRSDGYPKHGGASA